MRIYILAFECTKLIGKVLSSTVHDTDCVEDLLVSISPYRRVRHAKQTKPVCLEAMTGNGDFKLVQNIMCAMHLEQ